MHCRDRAKPGTSFVEICLTIRRTIRKGQGSPTSSRIVQQISSYRCAFHEFLRIDSPDQLFGSDPEGSKVQKPTSANGNTGKDADEVPFTEDLAQIAPDHPRLRDIRRKRRACRAALEMQHRNTAKSTTHIRKLAPIEELPRSCSPV